MPEKEEVVQNLLGTNQHLVKREYKERIKNMVSNSDVLSIRKLYRGFNHHRLHVTRWLGSNGDRFKVHELVITNYEKQQWLLTNENCG